MDLTRIKSLTDPHLLLVTSGKALCQLDDLSFRINDLKAKLEAAEKGEILH